MLKTIDQNLTIILAIFLITLFSSIYFLQQNNDQQQRDIANQSLHQNLANNIIKELKLWQNDQFNSKQITSAFKSMMLIGPVLEIYIVDPQGKLLNYMAEEEKIFHRTVDTKVIERYLNQESMPIYGVDPRSKNTKKIFSTAPILSASQELQGYLYVIIGGEIYDNIQAQKQYHSQKFNLGLLFLLISVLLIGLFFFIYFTISKPSNRLVASINNYKNNGFEILPGFETNQKHVNRNILFLSKTIKKMAKKISHQIEALNKNDQLRRELIIQLSHDLRTPVASQKAYLETIDQLDLPKDKQQQFIKQAISNTNLLEARVDDILQLARLDNHCEKLNIEQFNLAELAFDIFQKYQVLANNKGVCLDIDCPKQNIVIEGDIAKFERVITNLIENAMRHCHKTVSINIVLLDNNQIEFSVNDDGDGISQEKIPYLFEPYYQVEKNTGSNGLGLTICQKIMQLHKSVISIRSNNNKGSQFYFELPLYQT